MCVCVCFSSKKLDLHNKQRDIRCQILPETPSAGLKTGIAPDSTADEGSFYSMDTIEIKASLRQFISRRQLVFESYSPDLTQHMSLWS